MRNSKSVKHIIKIQEISCKDQRAKLYSILYPVLYAHIAAYKEHPQKYQCDTSAVIIIAVQISCLYVAGREE